MTYESVIYAARHRISKHWRKKSGRYYSVILHEFKNYTVSNHIGLLSTINEYQADLGFANKVTTNYGLRSRRQYFQLLQYLAKLVFITMAAQQQCEVIC